MAKKAAPKGTVPGIAIIIPTKGGMKGPTVGTSKTKSKRGRK
jgi:hypothetical protein